MVEITTINDLKLCCWCCLSKCGNMVPLFSASIDLMINSLCDIKVKKIDGYPQQVCKRCIIKISTSYEFIRIFSSSQSTINELLLKPEIKMPETNKNSTDSHRLENLLENDKIIKTRDKGEEYNIEIEDTDEYSSQLYISEYKPILKEEIEIGSTQSNINIEAQNINENCIQSYTSEHNHMDYIKENNTYPQSIENYESCENVFKHKEVPNSNYVNSNENYIVPQDFKSNILTSNKVVIKNIEDVTIKDIEDKNFDVFKQNNQIMSHQDKIKKGYITIDSGLIDENLVKCGVDKIVEEESGNISLHQLDECSLVKNARQPSYHLCMHCGIKFKWRSSLYRHQRLHTGKHSTCFICDKTFPTKADMKMHRLTHEWIKRFECNICKAKFSQKSSLNCHKKIHLSIRQFACNLCDKTFIQKGSLLTHMRTHTGEKPFECKDCEKKFAWKGSLKSHMLAHVRKDLNVKKNKKKSSKYCNSCQMLVGEDDFYLI